MKAGWMYDEMKKKGGISSWALSFDWKESHGLRTLYLAIRFERYCFALPCSPEGLLSMKRLVCGSSRRPSLSIDGEGYFQLASKKYNDMAFDGIAPVLLSTLLNRVYNQPLFIMHNLTLWQAMSAILLLVYPPHLLRAQSPCQPFINKITKKLQSDNLLCSGLLSAYKAACDLQFCVGYIEVDPLTMKEKKSSVMMQTKLPVLVEAVRETELVLADQSTQTEKQVTERFFNATRVNERCPIKEKKCSNEKKPLPGTVFSFNALGSDHRRHYSRGWG